MSAGAEPQDADLPKALVKRLIKAKLQGVDKQRGGDGTRDFQINKDALLAFGEAGKVFIHYLTLHANDLCKEAKRQTISAEDVLAALTELEFDEFIEPLKEALEGKHPAIPGAGGDEERTALRAAVCPPPRLWSRRVLRRATLMPCVANPLDAGFKAETREKNKKKAEASKKRKSDAGAGVAAASPAEAEAPAAAPTPAAPNAEVQDAAPMEAE
jgi:histone H3/H4